MSADAVRAHVPRTAPHAGDRLLRDSAGRVAEWQDLGYHSPDAHDVISAELVACTLGQRSRPELTHA